MVVDAVSQVLNTPVGVPGVSGGIPGLSAASKATNGNVHTSFGDFSPGAKTPISSNLVLMIALAVIGLMVFKRG